jgi:hypothetical protein
MGYLPAPVCALKPSKSSLNIVGVGGDAIVQEIKRHAAVLLLQQRLPVLLRRRHMILHARRQIAVWGPWLSRMHALLGGLAAEAASSLLVGPPSDLAPAAAGSCGEMAETGASHNAAATLDNDKGVVSLGQTGDCSAIANGPEASDSKSESGISISSNLRPPPSESKAEGSTPRRKDNAARTMTPREGEQLQTASFPSCHTVTGRAVML